MQNDNLNAPISEAVMVSVPKTSGIKTTLSTRQQQILALLAEGKTNKEIATELKIAYGTVKQHLFTIFRILGVSSRAKATVVAGQFLRGEAPESSLTPAMSSVAPLLTNYSKLSSAYYWRLISSVAVMVSDVVLTAPTEMARRDLFLGQLRELVSQWVQALDGQWMPLPDGGLLVWFGHPVAHLDDTDRATHLAQLIQSWADAQGVGKIDPVEAKNSTGLGVGLTLGVGVATHAEVVAERATHLFVADSFRLATALAQQAIVTRCPLTNSLANRLAPLSTPWLAVRMDPKKEASMAPGLKNISAIGSKSISLLDVRARWGGLPFLSEVCLTVKGGVSQWLAVDSWPPANATALIDAIGNSCTHQGFTPLRLRLPNHKQRDRVISSLFTQIESPLLEFELPDVMTPMTAGERLATLLVELASRNPLVLQVYGVQALETLKYVLGDKGVDRLIASQILIVAANITEAGAAQTSVRVLGARPTGMPFTRSHEMQVPDMDMMPEGIRVDLQAILDGLSEMARDVVIKSARAPEINIETHLLSLEAPRTETQECIQELTSLGLIVPAQGGGFEFRDLATAKAIGHMTKAISSSEG